MELTSAATSDPYTLTGVFSALCGPTIIVSKFAGSSETKQTRFPRSKRKRIRRKWAKDRRNYTTVSLPGICQLPDGTFVMDPVSYAKLQEEIAKESPLQPERSFAQERFFSDLQSIYSR